MIKHYFQLLPIETVKIANIYGNAIGCLCVYFLLFLSSLCDIRRRMCIIVLLIFTSVARFGECSTCFFFVFFQVIVYGYLLVSCKSDLKNIPCLYNFLQVIFLVSALIF